MERFIGMEAIAERLSISVTCVKKHLCGERLSEFLRGLPAAITRKPRRWLESDIDRWLRSRSTFDLTDTPFDVDRDGSQSRSVPRRGRPTKSEEAEARRLGCTVSQLRRQQGKAPAVSESPR